MEENLFKNSLEKKIGDASTVNAVEPENAEANKVEVGNGANPEVSQAKKGISMKDYDKKEKRSSFWNIVNLAFFYLLLVVFLGMIIFMLIGYRPAVVLTGSMRPAINPGDVTVYKAVNFKSIEVGDIIMFNGIDAGDTESTSVSNITHRVVELHFDTSAPYVVTRGDANSETATEVVYADQVVGKVVCVIPWIGIPLNAIRNNLFVFIFGALSVILIIYIISLVIKNKE